MNPNKIQNLRYFEELSSDKQKHILQHNNNNKHQSRKDIQKSKKTKTRTKSLKKQIHDTQRLLFKDILCEEGVKSQQLKLEQLKKAHAEERRDRSHKKRAKKYKGIKFFDSRKVLKKLHFLQTSTGTAEQTDALEEIALYKRYLNYITYYPEDKKYLSLFPNSERLDPDAQAQIDALLRETNSKVEQGLYADAWTAYSAKTPTQFVGSSAADIPKAEEVPAEETADLNSPPLFIPIDTNGSQSPKKEAKLSKKRTGKLSFSGGVDTCQPDQPTQLESVHDNSITEMECGEDLQSDSFFFFDTTGSKPVARMFKNRPQKRNFQDTRDLNQTSRNSKHNSKSSKHYSWNSNQKGRDS